MKTARTLALIAAAALAACSGSDKTKVTLMLTDAASPELKAAVVTITQINLQGSNGVTVLSNTKTTTNLLTLANDAATLLKDVEIEAGTYSELRFVISGGYVKVAGQNGAADTIYASSADYEGLPAGAQVDGQLKMPSMGQSGLKVDVAGGSLDLQAESKVLLVDFNVAQSFGHDAGGSNSWVMHPVIKGAELSFSGNIAISVKLAADAKLPAGVTLANYSAVVTDAGGTSETFALTDNGDGSFGAKSKFLLPGTYTVSLAAPAVITTTTTTPALPASVTVQGGADATVAITITAVQ